VMNSTFLHNQPDDNKYIDKLYNTQLALISKVLDFFMFSTFPDAIDIGSKVQQSSKYSVLWSSIHSSEKASASIG
jgi:hypothetical protein